VNRDLKIDSGFRTADPEMVRIVQMAKNIAPSRATVLISGESGTGKEVLARFIHSESPRKAKRFVAVNCAAIPADLLESELFGYEKGAFTGAHLARAGKFELAHEGTFLLDEVSEMPLALQAKLLRVIQEGEIERLGALGPKKINIRLIATTNRDLSQMVASGLFREDLYYRINVIPLTIPALRVRPKDIEQLAHFFMNVSCHMNGGLMGERSKTLSQSAVLKLKAWSWPGNVRELENTIERSVLMAKSDILQDEDIMIDGFKPQEPAWLTSPESISAGMTVHEVERRLIFKTLEHTGQNRTQAAKLLGISIRTLRNKLHEYAMTEGRDNV